MQDNSLFQSRADAIAQPIETNKVLRNTYLLLAMTMVNSTVFAGIAMAVNLSQGMALLMTLAAFGMIFVIHATANSSKGLIATFVFTALMGASLGPMLQFYLALSNGPTMVMQALGGTAVVFFGLSAYALTTRKDFSYMGGFLMIGLIVAVVAGIANIFLHIPALSLTISAAVIFIMSGLILFDTSRIINGGETNYIRATVGLYLNIYNLFVHLLHLISVFTGDD